jgi:hypothetical protein
MIPTTGVTDTYDFLGTEEQDAYSVNFYADLYENELFRHSLTLSGSVYTVDDRTSPTEYGPHDSAMFLDLTGTDRSGARTCSFAGAPGLSTDRNHGY